MSDVHLFMAFEDGSTTVRHCRDIPHALDQLAHEEVSIKNKQYNNPAIVTATITRTGSEEFRDV